MVAGPVPAGRMNPEPGGGERKRNERPKSIASVCFRCLGDVFDSTGIPEAPTGQQTQGLVWVIHYKQAVYLFAHSKEPLQEA